MSQHGESRRIEDAKSTSALRRMPEIIGALTDSPVVKSRCWEVRPSWLSGVAHTLRLRAHAK